MEINYIQPEIQYMPIGHIKSGETFTGSIGVVSGLFIKCGETVVCLSNPDHGHWNYDGVQVKLYRPVKCVVSVEGI